MDDIWISKKVMGHKVQNQKWIVKLSESVMRLKDLREIRINATTFKYELSSIMLGNILNYFLGHHILIHLKEHDIPLFFFLKWKQNFLCLHF
jgi:hypothetical protein